MLVMDVKQIREQNLKKLIDQVGGQAALARCVDTAPAYLSQILSSKSKKSIGDDLARRLEGALKLDHGWMDQLHDSGEAREESRASALASRLAEPTSVETHFTPAVWPLVKLLRDMDLNGTLPPDLIEGMTLMLKSWQSAWGNMPTQPSVSQHAGIPNRPLNALLNKSSAERAANETALATERPWESITGTTPADSDKPEQD